MLTAKTGACVIPVGGALVCHGVGLLNLHLIKIETELADIVAGLGRLCLDVCWLTFSIVIEHWPMELKELG